MLNKLSQIIGPEYNNIILTILIAALRGLLNHDNLWTVLIDSALCSVFTLAILHTDYFSHLYAVNHDAGILVCIIIGGVGSKYILKVIQSFLDGFISKKTK